MASGQHKTKFRVDHLGKHAAGPHPQIGRFDLKNYLNEAEITNLNEIVTMCLDHAERRARRGSILDMQD